MGFSVELQLTKVVVFGGEREEAKTGTDLWPAAKKRPPTMQPQTASRA